MATDLCARVSEVYLPGDAIRLSKEQECSQEVILLGPGLREAGKDIIVTKTGSLRMKQQPLTYWIDCHQRRYVPVRGDNVIGVVTNKLGDSFKVHIGSSEEAVLSSLAFPGATKKNKPTIKIGDAVYAKLLVASKDMEAELVCVNSQGEGVGLGVLAAGGFLFTIPLHHVRKILSPKCTLLKQLGKVVAFEIAVGMNGRIWVKAKTIRQTLAAAKAISLSEHMSIDEISVMCRKLSDNLAGF